MKIYMWLNSLDKETVMVGSRTDYGSYICWGSFHIDSVDTMFGNVVRQAVQDAPDPICVEAFNLRVDEVEIFS